MSVKRLWRSLWGGTPPSFILVLISSISAVLMIMPILYVMIRGIQGGVDKWLKLLDTRIPQLIWNTFSLTISVTLTSLIIGITLAWLVVRTDLPGKRWWSWLLVLPLVIPPYVGAMTYIIVFGPRGWIRDLFGSAFFHIYGFWGAWFVLVLFTYPYVYLITAAALRKMNHNLEEAGLSSGLSYRQVFLKVVLPILRPAMGAGGILVSLYVLSDFGAVAMMRYNTFTSAIYYQMDSFDRNAAAIFSFVLILITLFVLFLEAKTREKQRFYQTGGTYRKPKVVALGKWKLPLFIYTLFIFIFAVLLPIVVLIYWSTIGLKEGAINSRFWEYAFNSLVASGSAALISMLLALPIIYLKSRYPSGFTRMIDKIAYAGYALPGVIVSLGIIFVFNQYIPWLYGTVALVIIAYILRFLPQAMQSGDAALSLVSPRLDEAARSLGLPTWKVILKVILPVITPGILAGGALVFVSALKELPATLVLRPPGYDTLAVRIWIEAGEAFYTRAAPGALLIILVSIIPLRWMLKKY